AAGPHGDEAAALRTGHRSTLTSRSASAAARSAAALARCTASSTTAAAARPAATTTAPEEQLGPGQAGARVDVVLAWHQTPDAILTLVVGLRRAGRDQAAIALRVVVPHDANGDPGHRIAVRVVDMAGDDAAARQAEFDALDLLAVSELERR